MRAGSAALGSLRFIIFSLFFFPFPPFFSPPPLTGVCTIHGRDGGGVGVILFQPSSRRFGTLYLGRTAGTTGQLCFFCHRHLLHFFLFCSGLASIIGRWTSQTIGGHADVREMMDQAAHPPPPPYVAAANSSGHLALAPAQAQAQARVVLFCCQGTRHRILRVPMPMADAQEQGNRACCWWQWLVTGKQRGWHCIALWGRAEQAVCLGTSE